MFTTPTTNSVRKPEARWYMVARSDDITTLPGAAIRWRSTAPATPSIDPTERCRPLTPRSARPMGTDRQGPPRASITDASSFKHCGHTRDIWQTGRSSDTNDKFAWMRLAGREEDLEMNKQLLAPSFEVN